MTFLLGVGFGVLGMWAYAGGKLQSLINGAPGPVQQAFSNAGDRINQAASGDQLRQAASTVQDQVVSTVQHKVQQPNAPQIVTPTAAEVAGRPSEPLPRYEPEGVHVQNG